MRNQDLATSLVPEDAEPIRISFPSSLGLGSVFSSFVPNSSSAIRSNASGGVEIQRLAFLVPLFHLLVQQLSGILSLRRS